MRPIVFLHLPKTAGQSVRAFLSTCFPKRLMFPGQLDRHLALYSASDLRQFSLFAGHFSWSMLDCLGEDTLFITVLREPVERIISFYHFLRRTASDLPTAALDQPQHRGLRAALDNPIEGWMSLADPTLGPFINSTIDNYYTYYFATRMMHGRGLVRDNYPESDHFITEQVLQVAIRNIRDRVKVFSMADLNALAQYIEAEQGFVESPFPWLNAAPTSRTTGDLLAGLANNVARAQELLHLRTMFDTKLYRVVI